MTTKLDRLDEEDLHLVKIMADKLQYHLIKNKKPAGFYDGTHIPETYGIALPPKMSHLKAVLGWPSIVVDTLEERLDLFGYQDPYDMGLDEIFTSNNLEVESSMVHHDSLLYGTGFAVVGSGYEEEPDVLITVESPNTITALWNKRLRRASAAFSYDNETGEACLYKPDENVYLLAKNGGWIVLNRDQHRIGRVLVVPFNNRVRSKGSGQSEITLATEYFTDAGARTAIRMEITSEFYSAPKEVILGGDKDLLLDKDGNPISQWTSYLGRTRQIPWNDDEESKTNPSMIQLEPADPKPFIDEINMFANQLAASAGFPASYLGTLTNMPTSADAMAMGESRLVKRAERRQKLFNRSWLEVARLALLVRDGEVHEDFNTISTTWMDASTPTRAATTDAVVKLVQSGVIPADSSLVADELNLTAAQRKTLEIERTTSRSESMLDTLTSLRNSTSERG